MALSKELQSAEARARADAGIDPAMSAEATNVIDDSPRGDPGTIQPQPRADAQPIPQRPLAPAKSEFDQRRDDIVARFRQSRNEAPADDADDTISDIAASGMQSELEPEPAPEPAAEQQPEPALDPEPVAPPAPPKTVKLKVNGEERELSYEDVIAKAQIALASEGILDEVKALKRQYTELNQGGQRATPPNPNQVRQNPAQTTEQPDPIDGDPATPHQEDRLTKLIEAIQFGADPTETRTLLQDTIADMSQETAKTVVTRVLAEQRLKDEGARTAKVLQEFKEKYPDIANDPYADAVIQTKLYHLQVEDMKAMGVDPSKLQTPTGVVTPADVAMAHRWYRSEGYGVRHADDMLETAIQEYRTWKGVKPPPQPADPAAKAAPRVDISVDRTARRAAIPQQPSRAAAPRAAQEAAPQPRDRSSIVQDEIARRQTLRGVRGI